VSCHLTILLIQGNSSRLADRTRPGSTTLEGPRSVLCTHPSFTFISWMRYPDEGVDLPRVRSLSSRCLVVLVASIIGPSIPALGNRDAGFEVGASSDEPSISVEDCGRPH